jgi:outer membrane protein OmpA-like peptidoglycan-associated protein
MVAKNKQKCIATLLLGLGLLLVVPQLLGCGGQIAFSDMSAIAIEGTPPAPPPAPPPPPEPPKRVEVTADRIDIKEKIMFDYDKATIKPESNSLLNEIASVIKANPQIKQISIEGHTDNVGSEKYNQNLSEERTASVRKYLIEQGGVAENVLVSKGWGETKPVADNETEEGKEKNRRVEFLITAQDEIKKVMETDPKTGEQREVSKVVKPAEIPAAETPAAKTPKEEKAEKAKMTKEEREEKAKKAKEEKAEKAKQAKAEKAEKAEKAKQAKAEQEAKAKQAKEEKAEKAKQAKAEREAKAKQAKEEKAEKAKKAKEEKAKAATTIKGAAKASIKVGSDAKKEAK